MLTRFLPKQMSLIIIFLPDPYVVKIENMHKWYLITYYIISGYNLYNNNNNNSNGDKCPIIIWYTNHITYMAINL